MAKTLAPELTLQPAPGAAPAVAPRGVDPAAVGLVLGGMFSVHFGAGVAALLFPRAGVVGVLAMRLGFSALVLLLVARPRLRGYTRRDWTAVLAFGAVLALMNGIFYQAVDRIPLGAAVTLEVLGPLTLSVVGSRRLLSALWAGLALVGVVLLGQSSFTATGFDTDGLIGMACALLAGVFWACYILLSARVGGRFPKADGLALSLGVAALLTLPVGVVGAGGALLHPVTLALGLAVGVLSSLVPYMLDLFALRRLASSTFAILQALSPAIAAGAAFVVLRQALTATDLLAMALVITASAGAVRTARR
ncbi:EamA family transporter [Spongisporangium articulatum]|uniref:EamA family transporter n=1 Tax=Spongisporangium articulatum TaxID=3362603 RepID=A0ABW8AJ25_9ACTN